MLDVIFTVLQGLDAGVNTFGHLSKTGRKLFNRKSGYDINQILLEKDHIIGSTINTNYVDGDLNNNTIIVTPYNFQKTMAQRITANPEMYNMSQIDLIKDLSVSQLERYYQPEVFMQTLVLPSDEGEYFIGKLPSPIATHAIYRGVTNDHDHSLLSTLGFDMQAHQHNDSKHYHALSRLDQIYFSQLYADYLQLKQWIGSTNIKTFDEFIQFTYTEKVRLETEEGWDHVIFELTTRREGQSIKVVLKPVKMMS